MSTSTGMALDFTNGGEEIMVGPTDPLLDALPLPGDEALPDPEMEPEKFNAISRAVLEDESEDFVISGPPKTATTLIAGYVDDSGHRYTSAEVRELRGRDEEAIERARISDDTGRYLDAIVRAGTVRVGEIEDPKDLAKALDTLLLGDRELLIMQIRRVSFGDTMELNLKCPFCDDEFKVQYSFADDVPLRPFDVEGCHDKSQRLFDVQLPSGTDCEVRLVDGAAQKKVYTPENTKKTLEELNTLILTELLVSVGGRPVKGVGPVLDMSSRDRKFLLRWLASSQPGPQYDEVKQNCPTCEREFPLVISTRDMFRGD